MAAPPPPSRFGELVDMLKSEYDRISNENQGYKDIRREWNRKIEEQATELNAMLSEFRDLERKHAIIKEQYENEILRLKGQAPNPQASSLTQPVPNIPRRPLPSGPQSSNPPYSPNSHPPADPSQPQQPTHTLSGMFPSSRALPHAPNLSHHQSALASTALGQSATTAQTQPNGALMSSPTQQSQPRGLQLPNPQQQPNTVGSTSGAGAASSIPPISNNMPPGLSMTARSTSAGPGPNSNPNNTGNGVLGGKMPSISLIPPNGGPSNSNAPVVGAGGATIGTTNSSLFKKEGNSNNGPLSNTSPSPNQTQPPQPQHSSAFGPHQPPPRLGSVPGANNTPNAGGAPGGGLQLSNPHGGPPPHPGLGMGPSNGVPPTHGEDWAVYQGRSPNGSQVNMKVNLQNSLNLDSVVCCVRYSWDGQYLATGSNRAAHIFNSSNGQLAATFSKESAAGNDRDDTNNSSNKNNGGSNLNGTSNATNNNNSNSNSNNNAIPGSGSNGGGADSYVRAVCFSPDGQWLITGAEDHVVKVWDVNTRKVKHLLSGHGTDIYSVDASQNGKFIISGSGDKRAKLWSLETGELLSTLGEDDQHGPNDGITSVSVSPTNQHVAAGSLDKIVRVWEVETGRLVRQFEGHRDSVYSVAFSPDGRLVLSGSLDKTLKLWDLAAEPQGSNQCRLTFSGHKDFVLSVAFSPNTRWLISGSKDRSVQFWDPRQSAMCLMLHGHKNSVISIAHNPVSKALATGSGDCRARTWIYS